jgi:hypothetical protein
MDIKVRPRARPMNSSARHARLVMPVPSNVTGPTVTVERAPSLSGSALRRGVNVDDAPLLQLLRCYGSFLLRRLP